MAISSPLLHRCAISTTSTEEIQHYGAFTLENRSGCGLAESKRQATSGEHALVKGDGHGE